MGRFRAAFAICLNLLALRDTVRVVEPWHCDHGLAEACRRTVVAAWAASQKHLQFIKVELPKERKSLVKIVALL